MKGRKAVLVGGLFEGCLKNSFSHFLANEAASDAREPANSPLSFYFVTDAVYFGREGNTQVKTLQQLMDESNSQTDKDFVRFIVKSFKLDQPFQFTNSVAIRLLKGAPHKPHPSERAFQLKFTEMISL